MTVVGGESHVTNVRYASVTAITGNVLTIAALAVALPAYATPASTWVALAEVDLTVSWNGTTERFRGSWRYADVAAPPAGWSAADVAEFNALHSVWSLLHQNSTLVRLDSTNAVPAATFLPAPYAENDPLASHPTTLDGDAAALGPDGGLAANTPDLTPGYPEYVGNPAAGPGMRSALASLADEESIALVAIPGHYRCHGPGGAHRPRRAPEVPLRVLDAPHAADIAGVPPHRAHYDSEYTALFYYPWIQIAHPLTGNLIEVPPSGSMLGLYAETDVDRGVFKAPANIVVANATDLVTRATKGDQEALNPEGINVIRDLRPQNRGIRVWGARTISSYSEWIMPHRLTALHLHRALHRRRHSVGRVRTEQSGPVGPGPAHDRDVPRDAVAARGPVRRQERGRLLREMRPLDDVTGRHRQRPSRRGDWHRADPAGRVRDFPHWPVHGRFEL